MRTLSVRRFARISSLGRTTRKASRHDHKLRKKGLIVLLFVINFVKLFKKGEGANHGEMLTSRNFGTIKALFS